MFAVFAVTEAAKGVRKQAIKLGSQPEATRLHEVDCYFHFALDSYLVAWNHLARRTEARTRRCAALSHQTCGLL